MSVLSVGARSPSDVTDETIDSNTLGDARS
jgi:hypothetical protein